MKTPKSAQHTCERDEREAWARDMEKITQRFHQNDGDDRAGQRDMKDIMDQGGQKTDCGKYDAALPQPARWQTIGLGRTIFHTSGCNFFS